MDAHLLMATAPELPTGREFPPGGGELGHRLRAHDWRATPLGGPETWTASLRMAMELLLATHSPVAIAWGPELLTLYNDAFAAITGTDRAAPIGPRLSELSPELWRRVGPLVGEAMRRREPVLAEDALFCVYRNGYAEERYASLSCHPIPDHAPRPDGVLIMLTESTDQVVGARRTVALRDVAAAAVDVSSVGDACHRALDAVSRHSADIPFAVLYVVPAEASGEARLAATAGLAAGLPASPSLIALGSAAGAASWPVAAALETNSRVIVDNLQLRFDPLPAGDWPLAPRRAVVVPLTTTGRGHADAALVVGASARRELDTSYVDFIELVASHVAAAMAGGRLHEDEERRAAARVARRLVRAKRQARIRALKARFDGILEERTRLAREIHDTLLQGITGIALQLRAALPHVQTSPAGALDILDGIAGLAEQTSREARQAVWNIRPAPLKGRAFVTAVETAAGQAIGHAPISLCMRTLGRVRRLSPGVQGVVLRVVREAVANTVRHAGASTIRVTLSYEPRRLLVTVADDGCGFTVEPDFRTYAGHWGLLGMQERAREIGGSLAVRSAPRRGTRVVLRVLLSSPMRPRQPA
jgi:signal transduction histidine kinase